MKKEEIQFLKESNAIEGVWDDDSLKQAIKAWNYLKKQPNMTGGVILKTHGILMKHHLPGKAGKFRECRIWVGDREGVSYKKIPLKIGGWCFSTNKSIQEEKEASERMKTSIVKQHHVYYEQIHPFIDGNGRTGRMFLNWMRLKMGLPLFVILEAEKWDYYKWFN